MVVSEPAFPAVASILLAAGGSRRMGRPKAVLPAREGGTLLAQAVAPHLEAGIGHVVVVLGCDAEAVRAEAGLPLADPRLLVVVNSSWAEGMSTSLRAGLESCEGSAAAMIALGDQAGVTAARVRSVAAAWSPDVPLVVPVLSTGRPSHPVLFGRCLWEELRALVGDRGARDVVRRHLKGAARVAAAPLADLDTLGDYRDYIEGRPPRTDAGLDPPY